MPRLKLKPESPLRTGTRVDAWLRFDGDDWYVTVKRELTNQARVNLQGEIDDILLHAPAFGGDLWIVVIVGVPDDLPPVVVGQLNALIDYTSHREAAFPSKTKRNVSIEVVAV